MKLKSLDGLFVAKGRHGRGVFTSSGISKGCIVGEYPYLVVPYKGAVVNYAFHVDAAPKDAALVIGHASIMNHSDTPNVEFAFNEKKDCFVFTAMRSIKAGAELFIHYGDDWFSTRGRQLD